MSKYHEFAKAVWAKARADKAEIDRKAREDIEAFAAAIKVRPMTEDEMELVVDRFIDEFEIKVSQYALEHGVSEEEARDRLMP